MSEYEKQQQGLWYDSNSPEIVALQEKSRIINQRYNNVSFKVERQEIMKEWFSKVGENCYIETPVFCDFGCHLVLGNNVYMNTNCVILDSTLIEIGDNTMIGSNVQLCTPSHSIKAKDRLKPNNEKALPVKIGKNCWIGSSVTITPGVTIGDNVVVGAGCTINKDIESNTLVRYCADNIKCEPINS